MPPLPSAPLTRVQKDSIGKWINCGVKNTVNCNCACYSTKFTYSAVVEPLLKSYCVGCHNSSSLGGGIDLSNYNSVKTVAGGGKLYGSISHATGFSPMPRGGSKLSDCQLKQVDKWIKAGSPNN
jgi:hypothetical protein